MDKLVPLINDIHVYYLNSLLFRIFCINQTCKINSNSHTLSQLEPNQSVKVQ